MLMPACEPKPLNRKALKEKYLECFRARSPITLRQTVQGLVRTGVRRDLLLAWAVADGHEQKHVAKLLSQCFCALGLRERRPGAGRPASPPGLLLLAFAHEVFGNQQRKCLRAACRASNGPAAAELEAQGLRIIPVPELYASAVARFGRKLHQLSKSKRKTSKRPL